MHPIYIGNPEWNSLAYQYGVTDEEITCRPDKWQEAQVEENSMFPH